MEGAKEQQQQQQQQKTKISFGFSSAHDKIKLIDILSEADDDFLVPSPFFDYSHQNPFSENARDNIGFRLSGFGNNFSEIEIIRQNEKNVLPSDFMHPTRPSFLRRSLAWDSAFFDSPGVLDHDELSFINKGFTKDVRKRRSEIESNADDNSDEWFEIAPSIYKAKSHKELHVENRSRLKQEGLQNARAIKNVEKSLTNKMKAYQISTGKSIDVRKNESISRMRKGMISSPKPPKALGRTTYISTRLSNRDFSGTTTTTTTTTTCSDSRLPNRKPESGNSKLSTKIQRDAAERGSNKRMGNVSLSTSSLTLSNNHPFIASPVISTSNYSSESRSAKSLKPSELRPPSPQMRFFDENTPTRYHDGIATSRKFPQKEYSFSINDKYASACKKLIKTPTSKAAKNVKHTTTNNLATTGEIHGKRPRNKLGLNSTLEEEKRRETLKSKRCRESINGNTTFSELASISKCLEAIDLNQDINRKPRKGVQNIGNYDSALSKPKPFQLSPPPTSTRRTPLAEKMYTRNSIGAFALPMEMKREKLG